MFNKNDERAVSAIRALSIAQIEAANSGHPGLPMGAAPMAYVLWNKFLKTNPKNPTWFDRDRFILSAGHGSAMLYALLHLAGYDVTLDDLKDFRQLKARTAGHPERGVLDGVEVTTGPLGQGIAQAVGVAIAEKHLAATYNKEDAQIIDHYTFALCGDGDLMEGISYEAMSLAGHLNLSKLIVLYDSNDICLDGPTHTTLSEDIKKRAESLNWNYLKVEDGTDLEEIYKAIVHAKGNWHGPTLIEIKTVIGYGSTNQGTSKVHGAPIGAEDFKKAKEIYEWAEDDFSIPADIYETFADGIIRTGEKENQKWDELLEYYKEKYREDYDKLMAGINRELPADFMDNIGKFDPADGKIATRSASSKLIQQIAAHLDNFWVGSADLFSSNKTEIANSVAFTDRTPEGRNIWYGVREFAMAAIGNGIMAHGGTWHLVSTFFVFSDYLKPAVRLSALSGLPLTYVMSHDSVAVGEDGPTHQPIEQFAMLRSIPGAIVIRPADANESRLAWQIALESKYRPVVIATSRQDLPILEQTTVVEDIKNGAYVISDTESTPDLILLATGSEVALALEAKEILSKEGHNIRVVSMPSMELFREADEAYKTELLPKDAKIVSIEMASIFGWAEWTGADGLNIGIDSFGMSGKGDEVAAEFGFTTEAIAKKIKARYSL